MHNPVFIIFGFGGIIGTAFHRKLCENVPDYRIFAFAHSQVDIGNREQVREILEYVEPDIVVNAAGLSNFEFCEHANAGAFQANAVGPSVLAEECAKAKARLVHFSSWAVFGGDNCKPHTERSMAKPINICGKSKLDGEKAIREALPSALIVRAGWLFDSSGDNFIKSWVGRADKGLNIGVYPDCHGSPTYAPDLIDVTMDLLNKNASGTFHVANSDAATWESMGDALVELCKCRSKVVPLSKRMLTMAPAMPRYSVLSIKKVESTLGVKMRPWLVAMKQCLFQMKRYKP